jgi:hypothetical protein
MIIRPVGAELFHADGRTDEHDEANSFSQFCARAQKMNSFSNHDMFFKYLFSSPQNRSYKARRRSKVELQYCVGYRNKTLKFSRYQPLYKSITLNLQYLKNQFCAATTNLIISTDLLWTKVYVF